jgi:hypothetical protein
MTKFELLDMVELLVDAPDKMLFAGMQGTIVEILEEGIAYLVEFADQVGRGKALVPLYPSQMKLVWSSATGEYVSAVDQLIEEARKLSEDQALELLGMIRNLPRDRA